MKFNELEINKKTFDAISEMGFEEMMPIQEKAIPQILLGKNVIGEAHTGTGKTAAFGIPLFEKIEGDKKTIQSLIMAPTRELAIQIVDELKRIGKNYHYDIVALVGGMSITDQAKALRNYPKIIVATPGRLVDHLDRKRLTLDNIKIFVLDEVDEMLKVGFKEEIDKIIELLPSDKQTLLFSATISASVQTIAQSTGSNFEVISVTEGNTSTDSIAQYCVITKENNKFATLTKLLDLDNPKLAILFGRTKRRADELNDALSKCGYKVSALHGDLSQGQRNAVLKKFKNNEINILVATDVAARGLDVTGVTHVYNFDLPQEVEYYIHRIGRTGRANASGVSYTFVRESELPHIERIKKETGADIKIIDSPSMSDLKISNHDKVIKKIDDVLTNADKKANLEFALSLVEAYTPEDLALALVEMNITKREIKDITLTGEPPVRLKGGDRGKGRNRDRNRGFGRDNRTGGFGSDRSRSSSRPAGARNFGSDRPRSGSRPTGARSFSSDRPRSGNRPASSRNFNSDRPRSSFNRDNN